LNVLAPAWHKFEFSTWAAKVLLLLLPDGNCRDIGAVKSHGQCFWILLLISLLLLIPGSCWTFVVFVAIHSWSGLLGLWAAFLQHKILVYVLN